ncbi:MAG: hypothetical protein JWO38_3979 [Gemmataceae bacterium]|nr:hypothetical protein [Gemmataceae bacterium]
MTFDRGCDLSPKPDQLGVLVKVLRNTVFVLLMIFGIPALIALPFLLSGFIGRM